MTPDEAESVFVKDAAEPGNLESVGLTPDDAESVFAKDAAEPGNLESAGLTPDDVESFNGITPGEVVLELLNNEEVAVTYIVS